MPWKEAREVPCKLKQFRFTISDLIYTSDSEKYIGYRINPDNKSIENVYEAADEPQLRNKLRKGIQQIMAEDKSNDKYYWELLMYEISYCQTRIIAIVELKLKG